MGKRMTFALTDQAEAALTPIKSSLGLNGTDAVNAGLRLLALYAETMEGGGRLQVRHADGEIETIRFI
jgi:hypothetical protein